MLAALTACGDGAPASSPSSPACESPVTDAEPADTDAVTARVDVAYEPDAGTDPTVRVRPSLHRTAGGPAEAVRACQRVWLTVDATSAAVPTLPGSVAAGHLEVRSEAGEGLLAWVDSATGNDEMDAGTGVGTLPGFPGWYGLVVDPAPGTYRWSADVTWHDPSTGEPAGGGRVDVVVVLGSTSGSAED